MSRISKVLFTIGLLLFLFVMFFVVVENQQAISLPVYLIPMSEYPLIGSYMTVILFWSGIGFMVLALLALLVVWFFPKQTSRLELSSDSGDLVIQKKAIENMILQIVKKEHFIDHPSVKVKMTKKKIKADVAGKMRPVAAVPERQAELVDKIKTEVHQLMGVNSSITTDVVLKDLATATKEHHEAARVV